MAEVGFDEIGTYVTKRQNMAAQYIATRHILYLCERSAQMPGAWVSRRWWYHEGLYLKGAKDRSLADSEGEEAQSEEEGMAQEETTGQE